MQTLFSLVSPGVGLNEFTYDIRRWITAKVRLTLFLQRTSVSLLIQRNSDPDVKGK